MPNYTYENKTTKEVWTVSQTMAEREIFLSENPEVHQLIINMTVVDPIGIGVSKPDSTFQKYILGKVKERNPLGNVERKFGNIRREI